MVKMYACKKATNISKIESANANFALRSIFRLVIRDKYNIGWKY